MTKAMQKLIDTVTALPEEEQDLYASSWMEDIKWEETLASPESLSWLEKAAEKAAKAFEDGSTERMNLNQFE